MRQIAFVQIGETALRSPTGEPLQNVPLYVLRDDANKLQIDNENNIRDICEFFQSKYKPPGQRNSESPPPTKATGPQPSVTAPKL